MSSLNLDDANNMILGMFAGRVDRHNVRAHNGKEYPVIHTLKSWRISTNDYIYTQTFNAVLVSILQQVINDAVNYSLILRQNLKLTLDKDELTASLSIRYAKLPKRF